MAQGRQVEKFTRESPYTCTSNVIDASQARLLSQALTPGTCVAGPTGRGRRGAVAARAGVAAGAAREAHPGQQGQRGALQGAQAAVHIKAGVSGALVSAHPVHEVEDAETRPYHEH